MTGADRRGAADLAKKFREIFALNRKLNTHIVPDVHGKGPEKEGNRES